MKNLKKILAILLCSSIIMGISPLELYRDMIEKFPNTKEIISYFDGLAIGMKRAYAASNDNYTITLTWGSSPSDLDAHLEGTLPNGTAFHCYYSNKTITSNSKTMVKLSNDDTSSYGPEIITICPEMMEGGTFNYYIYNFSKSGTMSSSNAVVTLKKGNDVIGQYSVPSGNESGLFWSLFKFEKGIVRVVNSVGNSVSSALGIPLGSFNSSLLSSQNGDVVIIPNGRTSASLKSYLNIKKIKDLNASHFRKAVGVVMKNGATTVTNSSNNKEFVISNNEAGKNDIVLSFSDRETLANNICHYNDYIIPKEVISSWKSSGISFPYINSSAAYIHEAYLTINNDADKPYISTVFAKESNLIEYKNIMSCELSAEEGCTYDIVISAGNINGNCKYYLEQNSTHKLESSDGKFMATDIVSTFTSTDIIYAFVKCDGKTSELVPVEISIPKSKSNNLVYDFVKDNKLNILGTDFLKLNIPSSVPLVGNAEISFEAFKFPAGFEMTDNGLKISIGANIFNMNTELKKTSPAKYKEWSKECFKDWKALSKSVSESFSDEYDKMDKTRQTYKKAQEGFYEKWRGTKWMKNKSKDWDIDVLGYIELSYVNGKYIVNEAFLSLEGSFSFSYTLQGALWGIPSYCYVEAGASIGAEGTIKNYFEGSDDPIEWDITLNLEPEVTLGAGVGVKGYASGGLYANATMPIHFEISSTHLTIQIKGEIGAEAQFLFIKGKKKLIDGSVDVLDHYFKSGKSSNAPRRIKQLNPITGEEEEYIITYEIEPRDYLKDTSGWLGNVKTRAKAKSIEQIQNGLQVMPLQTSVYDDAQAQIVAFGDKMLMTYIEDCSARDEYNRLRLMYSIYDGSTWSQPVPVCDDGCNDNAPKIVSDGKDVYFVWQKINKILTEDDCKDIENIVGCSETYIAKYEAETDSIINVRRLSNDNIYDYSQTVSIVNGQPVVYWVGCNDSQISKSLDNTIYRSTYDGIVSIVSEKQNYIISLDAAYIDGLEEIAFSTDGDGNTETTDDITLFTCSNGILSKYKKFDDSATLTYVRYGELDGKNVLFVSDMSNIYYYDKNNKLVTVFDSERPINGSIDYINDEKSGRFIWIQNETNGNILYSSSYVDGEWTSPVKISDGDSYIGSVDAEIYNGIIKGVCTSTVITIDDETLGYENGQTDLCAFNLNDIYDLSVDMISIDERNIRIGKQTNFTVFVNNNGTKPIEEVAVTVSDGIGYEQTCIKEVDLLSGESKMLSLEYTAPSNYQSTELTVTIAEDFSESNNENNSISVVIGKPKIIIEEPEIHMIGSDYVVTSMVTNESDILAENIVVSSVLNDETEDTYSTHEIDMLQPRESALLEFIVNKNQIKFDEDNVGKIYISTNDETSHDSQICAVLTNNIHECAHPVTITSMVDATCTTNGLKTVTCEGCGEIKETVLESSGHDIVDGVCSVCGFEAEDISANDCKAIVIGEGEGHKYFRFVPESSETYYFWSDSIDDVYGYLYDNKMNCLTSDNNGGDDGNCLIAFEFETGKEYYFEVKYNSTEKTGSFKVILDSKFNNTHDYQAQENVLPTCEAQGYSKTICSRCGKEKLFDYVDATGHSMVAIETIDPTCILEGYIKYVCSYCYEISFIHFPALGHKDYDKDSHCDKCGMDCDPTYVDSDIFEYGNYPQSEVKDEELLAKLNAMGGEWISYGYYGGSGSLVDGQMQPSDYMRYKDVSYNGNKYRAVTFDSYRPSKTGSKCSEDNSYQDENGYTTGNVYWFKYEPIKWRVLDSSTGLILCDTVIDAQAYNNYFLWQDIDGDDSRGGNECFGDKDCTYYASNYAMSSIRYWMNNDFYYTAFSDSQKSNILITTLDSNSIYSSVYDAPSTTDKLFLLSYEDSINSKYGFSTYTTECDIARRLQCTDYAKCQGCYSSEEDSYLGNCKWWLRSPRYSYSASCVNFDGYDGSDFSYYTDKGVVPALRLKYLKFSTSYDTFISSNGDGTHSKYDENGNIALTEDCDYSSVKTEIDCLSECETVYTCTKCNYSYSQKLPALGHTAVSANNGVEATCSTEGKESDTICSVCGITLAEGDIISTLKHVDTDNDGVCDNCSANCGHAYVVGDIIEYGNYPQSEVKDEELLAKLNAMGGKWISYEYYSGTGNDHNGQMEPSDYMRYKDVSYNGNKYRAVTFDSYRPYYTGYISSTSYTYQDDNGYTTGNVYWFKFEPIKWRVLDPSTGLIICDTAIDSQAYNNYVLWIDLDDNGNLDVDEYFGDADCSHYASDYSNSSIREWLNNDFYNTAFSASEKSNILETELDNSSYYSSSYDAPSIVDMVFLLSQDESNNNKYEVITSDDGFVHYSARQLQSTDYAKSQGCYQSTSSESFGNCYWWLRSANGSGTASLVGIYYNTYFIGDVGRTRNGVVPALRLQILKSDTSMDSFNSSNGDGTHSRYDESGNVVSIEECTFTSEITIVDCTSEGYCKYTCTECKYSYTVDVPATGHYYGNWEVTLEPTCSSYGTETSRCAYCESSISRIIETTDHSYSVWITDYDATCYSTGRKYSECDYCISSTYEIIEQLEHIDENSDELCDLCNAPLSDKYIAAGQCGKNVYWTLSQSGDLRIYGTGYMSYKEKGDYVGIVDTPHTEYRPTTASDWSDSESTTDWETRTTTRYIPTSAESYTSGYYTTSSTIPEPGTSIRDIGKYDDWTGYSSFIQNVIIEEGVTSVFDSAFKNCSNLKSVSLPSTIKIIGDNSFEACISLKEVTIPKGVINVGNRAFAQCKSLEKVNILSVNSIFDNSFANCTSLTEMFVGKGVGYIPNIKSLQKVIFEEGSTFVPAESFYGCDNLTSVVLPDTIKTIEDYAFYNCESLTEIELPMSLTYIGNNAFNKTGLSEIDLPMTIRFIGEYAFANLDSVTELTIPENVEVIGYRAFANLVSLRNINFNAKNAKIQNYYYSDVFANCGTETDGIEVIFGDKVIYVPEYIFEVGSDTAVPKITSVKLGKNVARIGESAFSGCAYLKDVEFNDGLKQIRYSAFYRCICLETIVFPESLERVSGNAFNNCTSLKNIELSNVSYIGDNSFYNTAIETLVVPESLEYIGWQAFDLNNLKTVYYNAVNCNADHAFYAWDEDTSLDTVYIGDNVQSIGAYTFYGIHSLEKVYFPDTIIDIHPYAFYNCPNVSFVCKDGSYVNGFAVQNGYKYILEDAENGTAFSIKNGYLSHYQGTAQNVVVPSDVTSIGINAFADNSDVRTIELSYSVTKIYSGAFKGCSSLDYVIIPYTVTTIGSNAFEKDTKIYCYLGSYAYKYAKDNHLSYELITIGFEPVEKLLVGQSVNIETTTNVPIASGVPIVLESSNSAILKISNGETALGISLGQATIYAKMLNGVVLGETNVTVIDENHEHSYVSTVIKEPTCIEQGTTKFICLCGDTYSLTTPALGHIASERKKENEIPATNNTDGSYESVVYCSVCNEELSRETVVIPALNKDYVTSAKVSEDKVIKGEYLTWTITTSTDVEYIKLEGKYTLTDGSKKTSTIIYKYNSTNVNLNVTDNGDVRTWTIKKKMSYTGEDEMVTYNYIVKYKLMDEVSYCNYNDDPIEIVVVANGKVLSNKFEVYAPYTLVSVTGPVSVKAGERSDVTIITTDDCTKVRIGSVTDAGTMKYTTYQTTTTNNVAYTDANGLRTWTISFKFTTDVKEYTVNSRGAAWGEAKTFVVNV